MEENKSGVSLNSVLTCSLNFNPVILLHTCYAEVPCHNLDDGICQGLQSTINTTTKTLYLPFTCVFDKYSTMVERNCFRASNIYETLSFSYDCVYQNTVPGSSAHF